MPARQFRYLDVLITAFVVILLVSNLVAQKIIRIGPLSISGGLILFPITYIFGDIFTEVYGYAASRRAIWLGFCGTALMYAVGALVIALPADPDFHDQKAFITVFGILPRLLIASLIAFWMGEFANSYTMARMKILTRGRWLWTRTIGSTACGELVDSTLFCTLAFAGVWSVHDLIIVTVTQYVMKTSWEVISTPLTYKIVGFLKRTEQEDYYDLDTNFTPFSLEVPRASRAASSRGFAVEAQDSGSEASASTTRGALRPD